MLNITSAMIYKIAPGANSTIVNGLIPYLNQYLPKYKIDTIVRMKHFFGQAAEETAGFKTLTEYASGREYEGRADLGNTQSGDGVRYKGRGIFQLTGRSNYTAMAKELGVDLVNNPNLAATPEIAVQTACVYWNTHNLSSIADSNLSFSNTCTAITRKINGGTNGLADRLMYSTRAETVLVNVTNVTTIPTTPTVPVAVVVNTTTDTLSGVFPTPVSKPVEVANSESVKSAVASNNKMSNIPIIYAVEEAEVFIKKFF